MILANLYNKVMCLFRHSEHEEVLSAKDTDCYRLRVVLMQDRTNLTPELMDRMRRELVELLSKYVEMDKEALDLSLEQDGEQVAGMLSIPVIRAKDEEEIKAALEAEDAEKECDDIVEDVEEEQVSDDTDEIEADENSDDEVEIQENDDEETVEDEKKETDQ